MIETINKRLTCLLSQVESIASEALEPLRQCEDVINQSLAAAKRIMEEGRCTKQVMKIIHEMSCVY